MVFMLCCYGCHKEDECLAEIPIGISAIVCNVGAIEDDESLYEPDTKTSYMGSTAAWANNDAIGLFCAQSSAPTVNDKYTVSGVGITPVWTPTTLRYWKDGGSTHTFYAYYPYNATSTATTAAIPILNNQVVTASATATPDPLCDMLVAGPKTQVRTTSTAVPLTFTHAFSLLQFNVKLGNILNLYVLNNITIQGGNISGGTNRYGIINTVNDVSQIGYNLATQSIQASANTSAVYATTLSRNFSQFGLLFNSATPFYFLIMPGTYANPVPAVKFTVSLLNLIPNPRYANLSNTTFLPNNKYTYNVTIGGILRSSEQIKVELVSQQPITSDDTFIN